MTTRGEPLRSVGAATRRLLVRALTLAALTMATAAVSGPAQAAEFEYSGDKGPGSGAQQSADWEACAGTAPAFIRQSPIDIRRARLNANLHRLHLNLAETPIDLFNNGHTIENEYEPGSTLAFRGVTYTL